MVFINLTSLRRVIFGVSRVNLLMILQMMKEKLHVVSWHNHILQCLSVSLNKFLYAFGFVFS